MLSDGNESGPIPNFGLLTEPFGHEGSIYIPSGRSFFSTPNKGFVSVSEKNLDWLTQRFSVEMDFEYRAMIESSVPKSDDLLAQFLDIAAHILGGKVVREGSILLFHSKADARRLPFQLLSSGTLELLPLLNPLARLVSEISTNPYQAWSTSRPTLGPFFVEEPESSIFPKTQYDLMRLFAWLSSEARLGFSFVITTHSPYILSSFNNLIYAGQLASEKPELKDEIAKMVPERFWIESGSFRAYSIQDGVLESILSESGLIDGEYLDSVSDTIGNEFDSLLRLEYDNTKAS